MKKSIWPVAIFNSSRNRRVGEFILNLRSVVLNIGTAVVNFPTPSPTLASVTTDINDLEAAEARAQTRAIGMAAARDVQADVCSHALRNLVAYVQVTANGAVDAATAIAIIESSGFGVRINGAQVKAPIAAKNTTIEGTVDLVAKSGGKNTVYMWERSADGIAWSELPITQIAKTSVEGLTPGQKMYFRVRTQNKNGMSEWSAAIAIIVV